MKYLKSIQRCAKYVAKRPRNISIMVEEVVQVVEPSLGVRLNQLKGKTERNDLYQGIQVKIKMYLQLKNAQLGKILGFRFPWLRFYQTENRFI